MPAAGKEVSRLEAMIADLQVAKQQTWAEKERLSEMYEEERRKNMASKVKHQTIMKLNSPAVLDLLRSCYSNNYTVFHGILVQWNMQGILDLVMDTLKKEQHEAYERLKVLHKEKDQLAASYKEKKKRVDDLKEQLQTKIGEYSKLSESGRNTSN